MIQSVAGRFSTAFQRAAGGNLLILRERRYFCVHRLATTSTVMCSLSMAAGSRVRPRDHPGVARIRWRTASEGRLHKRQNKAKSDPIAHTPRRRVGHPRRDPCAVPMEWLNRTIAGMFGGRRSAARALHAPSLYLCKNRFGSAVVARRIPLAPRWSRSARAGFAQIRRYGPP